MSHYNEDYFAWQKEIGIIGGYLNKFKFENEVKEDDILMDFGCGGGCLLYTSPSPRDATLSRMPSSA